MPCLFLNTERGFGGKPPKKSGFVGILAGSKMPKETTIDGAILKINVRVGGYAQAGFLSEPLMIMGSVDQLHVRVDIDEAEIWRIRPATPRLPACAAIRRSRHCSPLSASSPMFWQNGH